MMEWLVVVTGMILVCVCYTTVSIMPKRDNTRFTMVQPFACVSRIM